MKAAIIGATGCTFQGKLRRLDILLEFLLFVVAELVLPDVATVPPAVGQSERIHLELGGQVFHSCVPSVSSYLLGYYICRPIDLLIGTREKLWCGWHDKSTAQERRVFSTTMHCNRDLKLIYALPTFFAIKVVISACLCPHSPALAINTEPKITSF